MSNDKLTTFEGGGALVPFDYGEEAGAGMDITMDDLKVPFISLAQTDSKILDEDEDVYAPGGAAGMLFNGATREYADELLLVPAFKQTTYVEWLPDRGGFVAEHGERDPVVIDARQNAASKYDLRTKDGNELQQTKSIYAIVLDAELTPVGYCIVPFASSKMGPWREYWTALNTDKVLRRSPIYSHLVRLSSKNDKNKKGDKFKNLVMAPARDAEGTMTQDSELANVIGSMLPPDSPAFLAGRELHLAVKEGRATADRDTQVESSAPRDADTDEVF